MRWKMLVAAAALSANGAGNAAPLFVAAYTPTTVVLGSSDFKKRLAGVEYGVFVPTCSTIAPMMPVLAACEAPERHGEQP